MSGRVASSPSTYEPQDFKPSRAEEHPGVVERRIWPVRPRCVGALPWVVGLTGPFPWPTIVTYSVLEGVASSTTGTLAVHRGSHSAWVVPRIHLRVLARWVHMAMERDGGLSLGGGRGYSLLLSWLAYMKSRPSCLAGRCGLSPRWSGR